jgi:hypothetical protein
MIILLDTHALLWSLEDSPRLSATARQREGGRGLLLRAAAGAARCYALSFRHRSEAFATTPAP